jgi:CO dehydrogenase maturation factor
MRIAFVGKGGAGKSTIAGTTARLLARRGEQVLVLDSDPMPGLAYAVGIKSSDAPIPDDAVEDAPDERPPYRLRLSPDEAVERYALVGPDGVRVLQFGKLRDHVRTMVRSQVAFRQIVRGLDGSRWHLVGDLPAGTRQAFFGWASFAETLVVVVEPTAKSVISARRLARLADADGAPQIVAVASKVRADVDAVEIARRTGLEVIAAIPSDDAVAAADRSGRPVVDTAPDSPAVAAIESMVEALLMRSSR